MGGFRFLLQTAEACIAFYLFNSFFGTNSGITDHVVLGLLHSGVWGALIPAVFDTTD